MLEKRQTGAWCGRQLGRFESLDRGQQPAHRQLGLLGRARRDEVERKGQFIACRIERPQQAQLGTPAENLVAQRVPGAEQRMVDGRAVF